MRDLLVRPAGTFPSLRGTLTERELAIRIWLSVRYEFTTNSKRQGQVFSIFLDKYTLNIFDE